MTTVAIFVNALPPDLPPERVAELLTQYRQERDCPAPNAPPRWYIDQIIAALEVLVVEPAVVS
jgi:hypothetical protein